MPSITAIPNSAINPIAADTLKGIPVTNSASTPPITAIGMTLMASSVSVIEPKLIHSSIAIITRLSGTTIFRRAMASCRLPNSPTHSILKPGRQRHIGRDPGLGLLDGAAEVAVAHAEFDRQIALLLLAIDVGRARQEIDRSDVAQRISA